MQIDGSNGPNNIMNSFNPTNWTLKNGYDG